MLRPPNSSRDLDHFPGLPNQPKRPKTPQDCLPNHPDRWFATALEMVLNQVTFKDLISNSSINHFERPEYPLISSEYYYILLSARWRCRTSLCSNHQHRPDSASFHTFLSQPDFTRTHVIDCRRYGFKIQFWKV
ncbi:hypothetical protein I7I51_06543 [Histoplasma capsulatum]|uniref:Uncharacterized protein n=1 Tax=Ajellomyces capsulatus TaxID=5037 RepID=A0A8A1MIK7_AJECA|nr:hypothetical protein I7I51_06543 [Histoplasma capsulatum]